MFVKKKALWNKSLESYCVLQSFSNQEDINGFANGKGKPEFNNPDIERVRR